MTTMMRRPLLQDLVKEAMEGTVQKVDINLAAMQQIAGIEGTEAPQPQQTKKASATPDILPTEHIEKLANALDYVRTDILKAAADPNSTEASKGVGPGQGAGQVTPVLESNRTEENIDTNDLGKATPKNQGPVHPGLESGGVQKGDPGNAMPTNAGMSHPEQPVEPIKNEKTTTQTLKQAEALMAKNLERLGLNKQAATEEELQAALEAAENRNMDAYKAPHRGMLGGLAGGAALGGLAGGLLSRRFTGEAAPGALIGTALGANAGAVGGGLIGHRFGDPNQREQSDIDVHKAMAALQQQQLDQKMQQPKTAAVLLSTNLERLGLKKQAEDAINPAKISAGQTGQKGATAPSGATPSEEGVPSEPSDVNKQKALIASNEAAINYTKGQAKADPKADMRDVVTEPAQSKATDPVLHRTLDHAAAAGPKIAADLTRSAAARALLMKLAEEQCAEKDEKAKGKKAPPFAKKEKESQLDTPQGQSGFSSAGMGGGL
jgi:outer membrane lipoprotein SlyB